MQQKSLPKTCLRMFQQGASAILSHGAAGAMRKAPDQSQFRGLQSTASPLTSVSFSVNISKRSYY